MFLSVPALSTSGPSTFCSLEKEKGSRLVDFLLEYIWQGEGERGENLILPQ